MIKVPFSDSEGSLSVEVDLQHTADVFLVNSIIFQNYKFGLRYRYLG